MHSFLAIANVNLRITADFQTHRQVLLRDDLSSKMRRDLYRTKQ